MTQDPSELTDTTRYKKLLELKHDELMFFVASQVRPRGLPMQLFYIMNLPLLGYIFYKIYQIIFISPVNWFYLVGIVLLGLLIFALVIIPLHEILHVLAFRMLGARKTSIHAQWNRMLFYAIADKFVMNSREFIFLALFPFVLINLALIAGVMFLHDEYKVLSLVALFFHFTGCIGDFALLNYLFQNKDKRILNYDDEALGMSYFYEDISQTQFPKSEI
jgi:hypothetical protein